VNYVYEATDTFWKNFYRLRPKQKLSIRSAWQIFKEDPFDPRLGTHVIHGLSGRANATIYGVRVESDLRVIFRIDSNVVTTLDIGTHDVYK
jgi:mRNA-degrading endonuclease RelE of RelBE toxin-antitoxin system